MLGAFVLYAAITVLHLNFFLGLLAVVIVVGILGIVLERFMFRRFSGQHLNGLVLSLGLSILLQNIALIIWGGEALSVSSPFRGHQFFLFGVPVSVERMFVTGVSIIILFLVYFFITRTKQGHAMQAMSQDVEAAALQGISIKHIGSLSFTLGCVLAGVAGALLAPIFYVSPFIGGMPVFKAFVVIVLGGLGSVFGAFVGGILLGVIDSVSLYYLGTMGDMAGFLILILFILFKPTGLFGYE